ncbi:MAG: hypothetical protein Q9228_002459 [Teloschistes exilis]
MTNTTTAAAGRTWTRSTNMNGYAQGAAYGQYPNGQIFGHPGPDGYNENFDPSMNGLSHSLADLMLPAANYAGMTKQNTAGTANGMTNINGVLPSQGNHGVFYTLPNGSLVYSDANGIQSAYAQYPGAYGLNAMQPGQLQQPSFSNMHANTPVTPRGHPWMVAQHVPQEVPELAAPRRTSLSSNEADSPQTPMFASYLNGLQPQIVLPNQQPTGLGNFSPTNPESPYQVAKGRTGEPYVTDFEEWTSRSPAIPHAIPAIDSPGGGRGSLEQIMHNPNATTNVYVRGLHPNTSDEMLLAYGKRFGDVDSAKSIIDTATGLCKGFGFIKYHNYNDAENCIRGFYYRKYEAKYARVGHNERLKTLANPNNTNLYLSNLPKSMNEAELQAIFKSKHPEFTIVNHKVLKDENGLSRGVGFARFETPEICQQVIEEFSGMLLDEAKDLRLQIRYADTDEQKDFKAKTAKSRQFKSTEYNRGIAWVQGTLYGYHSPTAASFGSPLQGNMGANMASPNALWMSPSPVSPITSSYPWHNRYTQVQPIGTSTNTLINPVPAQARASSRVKIQSPSVTVTAKKDSSTTFVNTPTDSEEEEAPPVSKLDFATAPTGETDSSPTKAKL